MAATDELLGLPAWHQAQLVRQRSISAQELLTRTLEQIDRKANLNAYAEVREDLAAAQAATIDRALSRGEDPGPLCGLPTAVKDVFDAAGFHTTCGSNLLRDHLASVDDVTTARLKAAGCVVLGKTNVPEFAHLPVTQNLVHGRSSNPHDPERTCGGSSGGSAVAVATGMCSVATAADGGGSTRIPAALCGLVGLKPSAGRIPSSVADTWGGLVSSGTVTRTVRDAAIQLDVLAGPHPHLAAIPLPPESFEATLGASLGRLRIGWSETLGYVPVRPEVARLCVQTVEKLADAGHEVESLRDQLPDTRPHPHGTLVAAGVVASILSTGGDLDEPSLSPTLKDMYVEVGRRLTAVEYVAAQARRWEIAAKIGSYFDRHDVVVTPTLACAAMRHDEDPWPERGLTLYGENHWRWYGFAYPFNLAGLPAISVPAGRTSEGLPVGLQIIGPQHQDGLVLRVAAEIDEIQPWDDWPIT